MARALTLTPQAVLQQVRLCVFCGEKPKGKTKEHVLPKWLIKLAGKPGETVPLGYSKATGKPIQFPYEQLTLPACDACNNDYAKLEGKTQAIFSQLFAEGDVTTEDLLILLDWFDKVRVGLWLWRLAMNGTPMIRKFHISQRMGLKDRLLFCAYFDGKPRGMSVFGTSLQAFENAPSCFGLAVNNIVFINASFDHLLSRQLGFPYVDGWQLRAQGEPEMADLKEGTGRLGSALLPPRFRFPGFLVGQSVFRHELAGSETRKPYESELLKDLMPVGGSASHLMVQSNGSVAPLSSGSTVNPSAMAGTKAKTLKTWTPLEVARVQRDIHLNQPDLRWIEPARRIEIERRLEDAGSELDMNIAFFEKLHISGGGFVV